MSGLSIGIGVGLRYSTPIWKIIGHVSGGGSISYPGLIAAWSAAGKTNDDEDRAILKDLTGNGHDITLNGFAFSEMSGYGGYSINFLSWKQAGNLDVTLTKKNNSFHIERFNLPNNASLYLSSGSVNSFRLKINGVSENMTIVLGVSRTQYDYIFNKDGEYYIDAKDNISDNWGFRSFNIAGKCDITVEILPEYPDALVFDGVDDYGINEDMPILTDYTIIAKRKITSDLEDYTKAFMGKCTTSMNQGNAFILEANLQRTMSFGISTTVLNINRPKEITWQIKNSYNGTKINYGNAIDDKIIVVGRYSKAHSSSSWKGAFYSAYLFDRSLDEQEIKTFIRKYIDPEYLLPSETTPDCYYDFSLGSNDDENPETIVDQSGNGNNAVAHNFAFNGMSGYGGNLYGNYKYHFDNLTKYQIIFKQTKIIGNLRFRITGVTEYNSNTGNSVELTMYKISGGASYKYFTKDGDYDISFDKEIYKDISLRAGGANFEDSSCNIDIEMLPEYPGALVFDGVDDYVSLDAFDSGFKTVFIKCIYTSLSTILYDQRRAGTEQEDCINTSTSETAFYGRNKYGKTYINGVYNNPDSTLIASKLANKNILITSIFKGDYTSTPCIASANINKGLNTRLIIYKFLGFKEALTDEQIQYAINKYNLLDGVDEIEVS